MLELLAYLRANGFKTFIVSGGGSSSCGPGRRRYTAIPPEQVVGSSIKTKFEMRDGRPTLFRLPEINFIDERPANPLASTSISAGGRSLPLVTPMAILKCCNGPR